MISIGKFGALLGVLVLAACGNPLSGEPSPLPDSCVSWVESLEMGEVIVRVVCRR